MTTTLSWSDENHRSPYGKFLTPWVWSGVLTDTHGGSRPTYPSLSLKWLWRITCRYRLRESWLSRLGLYLLGNNLFWSIFDKRDVPKDGHCFIRALILSLSTLSPDLPCLTYDHVLTSIKYETNSNNEKYSLLLYDQGETDIEKIITEYINDKNYNEECGVLVPAITADAINNDLVILKEKDDDLCYEFINGGRRYWYLSITTT